MSITVEATYENGILKLEAPLPLPDRERIRVTVHWPGSVARQSAGLIPWKGDWDVVEQIASDPEYGILESP